MSDVIIHSDGAARGNPGPAGAGAVLTDREGKVVGEVCRYLGDSLTNNQAEYRALLLALAEAAGKGATRVCIYADSELMVKQIRGEYRVKNEGIKPLFQEVMGLLRKIGGYTIEHVPREKNKRADQLANLAIDGQML
ncbi:MAG: ribonuclease HI family protein [Pseudomonadota bacterium]